MNNPLSFSSVKLDLFSKDGAPLKPASGFVVEAGKRYYLITNRHVLSGRDIPARGQGAPAAEPYLLKTFLHLYGGDGENSFPLSWGTWKKTTIRLYDDSDAPAWMEGRAEKPGRPAAGAHQLRAGFWRTSSITSETIKTDTSQVDTFFIDPCALDGMTGSPVVGMKSDRVKLLGVYSDRSTIEFDANLGIVWDALLVKELIGASQ